MKKRILSILLAISCITALVVAVPVLAGSPSNQGFESNTGDWKVDRTITRVQSGGGTLSLPASSGGYYAEITNLDNGYGDGTNVGEAGSSYYGAGSGGNSVYNGPFYQSIDVYINANWAPATTSGVASFWIDMTPYHANPDNYGAEHNFHLTALGTSVTVSVDGDGSPMATITSSGWYSFVMTYSKDANPANPVITNMMVYHANTLNQVGSTATTYANSPGGPFPSSALGGSGYVWLTVWQNGFANDILGIDNVNTGLLPYEVVAENGGNGTTVSGTMPAESITVGAPSAISFGTFTLGMNGPFPSATPGTVTAFADTWQVDVTASSASMKSGGDALTDYLQISSGDTWHNCAASPTIIFSYMGNPTSLPFEAQQNIVGSDLSMGAGAYTITITFTGHITN